MNSRKPSGLPVSKWWSDLAVDKGICYPQVIPIKGTAYDGVVYNFMHTSKTLPLLGYRQLSTEKSLNNNYIYIK